MNRFSTLAEAQEHAASLSLLAGTAEVRQTGPAYFFVTSGDEIAPVGADLGFWKLGRPDVRPETPRHWCPRCKSNVVHTADPRNWCDDCLSDPHKTGVMRPQRSESGPDSPGNVFNRQTLA